METALCLAEISNGIGILLSLSDKDLCCEFKGDVGEVCSYLKI